MWPLKIKVGYVRLQSGVILHPIRDIRLRPGSNWELRSSGILRSKK